MANDCGVKCQKGNCQDHHSSNTTTKTVDKDVPEDLNNRQLPSSLIAIVKQMRPVLQHPGCLKRVWEIWV